MYKTHPLQPGVVCVILAVQRRPVMNDIYKVTDDDLLEAWKTSNDLFKEYLRTNGYEHNAIKFFCRHTEIPVVIHYLM